MIKHCLGISLFFIALCLIIGSAAAFFQVLLQWAYDSFHAIEWLVFCLPLFVLLSYFLYPSGLFSINPLKEARTIIAAKPPAKHKLIDWLHAPFIVFSTVLAHLGGASVGREGAALQLGAGISNGLFSLFEKFALLPSNGFFSLALITRMGMAAGFGALFQSPLAAAVFVFESFSSKDLKPFDFLWVGVASFSSAIVFKWFNVRSLHLPSLSLEALSGVSISYLALVLIVIAVSAFVIAALFLKIKGLLASYWLMIESKFAKWVVLFLSSCLFLLLTFALPFPDYYGLGLDFALRAFAQPMDGYEWFIKLFLTALLLSAGVKGGEVTPLFCMGALAGSALAGFFNVPVSFFAAAGLVAVFTFVSKAPAACFLLALEQFGFENWLFFLPFCFFLGLMLFIARSFSFGKQLLPKDK